MKNVLTHLWQVNLSAAVTTHAAIQRLLERQRVSIRCECRPFQTVTFANKQCS